MSRGWIAACLAGLVLVISAPRAPAADSPPPSRCDAAQRLADAGRTNLSDKQVLLALDDLATRECGLAVVEKAKTAKDAKAADDETTSVSEALSAVGDVFRKAWPWLA